MKAYETSERYVGKVRECCNYAVRSAKNFVDNGDNGRRQPGGNGSAQLRSILQNDLTNFCDEVVEEPFSVDQKAYIVSNLITFIFMLLAAALGIVAYYLVEFSGVIIIAALIFSVLSLLAFFGAFGGTSKNMENTNVYAKRHAASEATHRIILEANLDAPYKRKINRKTEVILKGVTFLGILLYLVFDVVELLTKLSILQFSGDQFVMYAAFVLVIFIFFPLVLSRTVAIGSSYPGVADNLSGCYTACGAMRYLSEMDLRLENTEVCVLLTDSKSNKSKGAKTFVKEFASDLSSIDTTVLCLDSIYSTDSFNINTSAKGRSLSKIIDSAAVSAEVMLTDHTPKYHKGEAKAFAKSGAAVATISSLPDAVPSFYRSSEDDEANLSVRAVEAAIKMCLEIAYAKDEVPTK